MGTTTAQPGLHVRRPTRSLARRVLFRKLEGLVGGSLTVVDGRLRRTFGEPDAGPDVTLRVHDARFYRAVLIGGSIGAGEAYGNGWWSADPLVDLIRMFVRNRELGDRLETGFARLPGLVERLRHRLHPNSVGGSRRNISAHYDLGNDFFESFLDPTSTYSCAYFETGAETLEQASLAKIDRLCRKLELGENDRLVEIGTGWGALAIHAARAYGCGVLTTTISDRQYGTALRRVREAGLTDRVEVVRLDYRDLPALGRRFDKLVSVEMIEAVGYEHFDRFFGTCSDLLVPGGRMALQAIVIRDQLFEKYRKSVDFIQRFIFPGGCLPSVGTMTSSAGRATDLSLSGLEDLTPHYARTLSIWRANLRDARHALLDAGYDARLLRLFDFYFAYCEGGFRERNTGLVQMVWSKPC